MSELDRAKWESRYSQAPAEIPPPSPWLVRCASWLPARGRALDLAGGMGRNALWLAAQGLDVTLLDISQTALDRATDAAVQRGLALTTLQMDLDLNAPAGPWDVVTSFNFLWLPLFERLPEWLAPGGTLFYSQPTVFNLERHEKPPAGYLLPDGILPGLVKSLETISYEEGWLDEGRHEARLVARRRA